MLNTIYSFINTAEHNYIIECRKLGVPNPIGFRTLMGFFTFIVLLTFSTIIMMGVKAWGL